jgi:transcriptional regulator with XRE-family HTH domain
MDMFRNLGPALRLMREERGLSQSALARAAGIGKSQLSKYESGRERPKLDSLEKLLTVLSIRVADFFAVVSLIDRELARIDGRESPGAGEPAVVSGLLPEIVQKALVQIHQDLSSLQSALVVEAVRKGLRDDA